MKASAFSLRPRNQRCQRIGIARRAWRRGEGAVGRPEPDAGDESAPDLSGTDRRYRRARRTARHCRQRRCLSHRRADAPCRSAAIARNCRARAAADGSDRPCRASRDPQPGHARRQPRARRSGLRIAGLHARAECDHHRARTEAANGGSRRTDFFTGIYETALSPQELLVAVELPVARKNSAHFFHEFARRHGDYAIVGLAAQARHGRRCLRRSAPGLLCGRRPAGVGRGREQAGQRRRHAGDAV